MELVRHGRGLQRPECVLAHECGRLFVSDWSGSGGIAVLHPDGSMDRLLAGDRETPLRPNGIALEEGGSFLLAHLGETDGGIYRLYPDGRSEAVLTEVQGRPLPPCNFVLREDCGRLWLTVSTSLMPRAGAYRGDVADGFIVVVDAKGARIAAEGLGYTNECAVSPGGERLYVNETFARRTSAFDIGAEGKLTKRRCQASYGPGTFPDGLALDREGGLWVTSIVSNRVIRLSPTGEQEVILEENEPGFLAEVEAAYQAGRMGRPHLDRNPGRILRNLSSLAFGGPQLKEAYLGCLLGQSLLSFHAGVEGQPPAHWRSDLAPLLAALAKQSNEDGP